MSPPDTSGRDAMLGSLWAAVEAARGNPDAILGRAATMTVLGLCEELGGVVAAEVVARADGRPTVKLEFSPAQSYPEIP